jgi:tRNA(fMet)-specific endonuclease VapC
VPYLVDTNIFIYARDGNDAVLDKFEQFAGEVMLSALSLAELQRGIEPVDRASPLRRARHRTLVDRIIVLDFDVDAAEAYGRIIAAIGRQKGRDVDHMIAAHALSIDATLVTNNETDFASIPSLAVENWAH